MTVGDVAPAQAEEPIIDTDTKDISVEVSTEKAFTVKPTFEDATQEALTVSNPKALVVTSKIRELLTQLTSRETSGPPSTPESTSVTVVETGSGSSPAVMATTTMDILEELTLQMIKQFFVTMTYYSKLLLSGRSSFEMRSKSRIFGKLGDPI